MKHTNCCLETISLELEPTKKDTEQLKQNTKIKPLL